MSETNEVQMIHYSKFSFCMIIDLQYGAKITHVYFEGRVTHTWPRQTQLR